MDYPRVTSGVPYGVIRKFVKFCIFIKILKGKLVQRRWRLLCCVESSDRLRLLLRTGQTSRCTQSWMPSSALTGNTSLQHVSVRTRLDGFPFSLRLNEEPKFLAVNLKSVVPEASELGVQVAVGQDNMRSLNGKVVLRAI
jgi:hypothetical protein